MEVKLTLKLNKSVIEKAKQYAKKRKRSLSKLVEDYFINLSSKDLTDCQRTRWNNFGRGCRTLEERVRSVPEKKIGVAKTGYSLIPMSCSIY
jgi:hypothetical protein